MAFPISTLNNASAVSKTFTKVGEDTGQAIYRNVTDTDHVCTLSIRQNLLPRNKKTGVAVRRTTVLCKAERPIAGTSPVEYESCYAQLTLVRPEGTMQALGQGELKDLVAFIRNFADNGAVDSMGLGIKS